MKDDIRGQLLQSIDIKTRALERCVLSRGTVHPKEERR